MEPLWGGYDISPEEFAKLESAFNPDSFFGPGQYEVAWADGKLVWRLKSEPDPKQS